MGHWFYLEVLGLCVLVTLPLEVLGARVWRDPRRLALSAGIVAVCFSVIDAVEVHQRLWHYNPRYVSGLRIGDLPIEEIAFFVVIPICSLLTYETVRRRRELVARWRRR